jgi:hypothetical protein
MEVVAGSFVMMEPGWTLAHWGPAIFQQLYSTEIHRFSQYGKPMVGASFYLYKGPAPAAAPKEFSRLGIGGRCRYTIGWDLGNQVNAYYKDLNPKGDKIEVAVILGCGGYISFNGGQGVSYYYTGIPPATGK